MLICVFKISPPPIPIATKQEGKSHFEKKTSNKDSRSERGHQKFGSTQQYLSHLQKNLRARKKSKCFQLCGHRGYPGVQLKRKL